MSVYCSECKHLGWRLECKKVEGKWVDRWDRRVFIKPWTDPSEKNKNCDCTDFEQAPPRTIWQTLKKCFAMS